MKIGFSLGRCIRDIVDGLVDLDDVAFLITSTNIHQVEHLRLIIADYTSRPDYLAGKDYDKCCEIAETLWMSNRMLQPRRQGLHRHKQPEESIWVDIFPTALSENEAVKNAWKSYRFMLHMTENVEDESMNAFKGPQ